MRLRLVETVDFRCSEAGNFIGVQKRYKLQLGPDDVVCLVASNRRQVVFMYRTREMDMSKFGSRKGTAVVFHSERLRLSRSTWEPMMLQNYANEVGIKLDGLRRFEEIYGEDAPGKIVKMSDHRAKDAKKNGHATSGRRAAA
jgi:hypothetical protein